MLSLAYHLFHVQLLIYRLDFGDLSLKLLPRFLPDALLSHVAALSLHERWVSDM